MSANPLYYPGIVGNMATEQVATLLAAVERLNARVVELEREREHREQRGEQRPRAGLVDKSVQPETFEGRNYHSWAEDFTSIVTAKNEGLGRAIKWAEEKQETVGFEEVTLNFPASEADIRELYVYLLHYLAGEPRIIAKGAVGNGVEAWRKLKNRYDPVSETSQVNLLLQVLQPNKVRNAKDLLRTTEKWEESIRRQHMITGADPITDGTKRALIIKMAPVEIARHLQLNAQRLDSYDKMRWEVVEFLNLTNPQDPIAMLVDSCDWEREYEEHYHHGYDDTEL